MKLNLCQCPAIGILCLFASSSKFFLASSPPVALIISDFENRKSFTSLFPPSNGRIAILYARFESISYIDFA